MEKAKIESAAEKFRYNAIENISSPFTSKDLKDAFKAGAEWALKNLWISVEERLPNETQLETAIIEHTPEQA